MTTNFLRNRGACVCMFLRIKWKTFFLY